VEFRLIAEYILNVNLLSFQRRKQGVLIIRSNYLLHNFIGTHVSLVLSILKYTFS